MIIYKLLIFLLCYFNFGNAKTIINGIAFDENGGALIYSTFVTEFNKFSKENNLDIEFRIVRHSSLNSTSTVEAYESMIEYLIMRKSNKYDIYFFDNIYTSRFCSRLLNLLKINDPELKDIIELYRPGVASRSCVCNDRWIGFPVNIDFSVLYSNYNYLNKYNATIPKTWDELLKTSKYIKEEERKKGNPDLMSYNGLFDTDESGTCSLVEFIYSFRDKIDSPFPEINSKETFEALEMLKKIKDDLNLDYEFRLKNGDAFQSLISGNFIFLKFWYFSFVKMYNMYNVTPIPGKKEGISGSTIGGHNVAINRYSKKENIKAAITVIKFISSLAMQKKLVLDSSMYSAVPSLYNDEEICKNVDCEFFRSFQLTPRFKEYDYTAYSNEFKNYIYEFLYNNKTLSYAIKKIIDLKKIYNLSLSTEDSPAGLILFIVNIIFSIIYVSSLVCLFMDKYKPYFNFLTKDLWVLVVFGALIIQSVTYVEYGTTSNLKCHLRIVFMSLGFSLCFVPLLYRQITNFPVENEISLWIQKRKILFILCILLIDILFISLHAVYPYKIKKIYGNNGENFYRCINNGMMSMSYIGLIVAFKILIIFSILMFIFIEWNIEFMHFENRFSSFAIYVNILSILLIAILEFLYIRNYITVSVLLKLIYMLMSLTNYVCLYGYRIIMPLLTDNDEELFKKAFQSNLKKSTNLRQTESSKSTSSRSNGSSPNMSSLQNKIINLHYTKTISNSESRGSSDINIHSKAYSSHSKEIIN